MSRIYDRKQNTAQKNVAFSASCVLDNSFRGASLQHKAVMASSAAQRAETPRLNNTGMPDNLKAGIESLSGFSMDDVRVHYNSSKPATVQALAYTQGTDIHVAPGQEKHLPHEAWHVAQQMAGRVSPTTNINGMPVNDNVALEHEADVMGEKAVTQRMKSSFVVARKRNGKTANAVQMVRPDPFGDDLGYERSQKVGGVDVKFNRDHIIPYESLRSFFNGCKDSIPEENKWKTNAESVYAKSSSSAAIKYKKLPPFFNGNDGEKLLNALCWMPGNIFLAPKPKAEEPSNGFDNTFASATDDVSVVKDYKDAFEAIKKEGAVDDALKKMSGIASKYNKIWAFDESKWLYDPQENMWYAKKIFNGSSIVDNPKIDTEDGVSHLLKKEKKESVGKTLKTRALCTISDVSTRDWGVEKNEQAWKNAKKKLKDLKWIMNTLNTKLMIIEECLGKIKGGKKVDETLVNKLKETRRKMVSFSEEIKILKIDLKSRMYSYQCNPTTPVFKKLFEKASERFCEKIDSFKNEKLFTLVDEQIKQLKPI